MDARRLKVLHVSARYLPQVGGIERHVFEVVSRLGAVGIDGEVLTTDATGSLARREIVSGVTVRRVRGWPRGRDYHLAPGIISAIEETAPDVVHVQGIHTFVAPMAMFAAKRAGIPFVVTFHSGGHSSSLRSRLRPMQWILLRPLLRNAARLIAVAEFERRHFSQHLRLSPGRFVVIPNGSEIVAERGDLRLGPVDPNLILSVGRVERYKGHWRLLEAMPHLLQARPESRLRIVGDGPDRPNLMRRAVELGISQHVEIAPIATGDRGEMLELLSRAGVFALLSDYEAHPVSVMEALSLGRPVLVADTTGLGELAANGMASAIPLDSPPDRVAAALLEELGNGRKSVIELPTWDDAAGRLADLYREVARR